MSPPSRVAHDLRLLEIGDALGEGGEREGVAAEIHLAVAVADASGAPCARRSEVVLAGEHVDERIRALQPAQRACTASTSVLPRASSSSMNAATSVSVSVRNRALGVELLAQLPEVLDDAVVNDGDRCGVRMGVGVGRLPCVAQRVWPMPIAPGSGAAASLASRF